MRVSAENEAARLEEIQEHLTDHQDIHEDDGWWLLGQLKRLRDEQDQARAEIRRLAQELAEAGRQLRPDVDPGFD
jgi:septation ring formation regulator EzrA